MAIKKAIREEVHQKYGGHCAYCGKVIAYKDMQVDHLVPKAHKQYRLVKADKDLDHIDNLMPSCRSCNHYKRANSLKGFRIMMKTIHKRIEKIYIVKVAIDYGIIKLKPFDGLFYFERGQQKLDL